MFGGGDNSGAAAAASALATLAAAAAAPPAAPPATAPTAEATPAAAAPAAPAAVVPDPAFAFSLMSQDEEENSPEALQCTQALKDGKRLLKEGGPAAAMVRFEKALMLAKVRRSGAWVCGVRGVAGVHLLHHAC
jgi:pyruvate dehydrogenase E2 component (dihydrolipoamide acetyltransferase)